MFRLFCYIIIIFFNQDKIILGVDSNININNYDLYSNLNYFPESIPVFHTRKDYINNIEVSRGKLNAMQYNAAFMIQPNSTHKISIKTFNEIAQCSNPIPDLNGNRGSFSMLRMTNMSKQALEIACAYLETGCIPYMKCYEYITKNKSSNGYQSHLRNDFELLRIINNALYYDWPWGNERNEKRYSHIKDTRAKEHYFLISMVLSFIKDLGDSYLFFGGEQASLNWNIPLPLFSFAPHISSSDLPFPWYESYYSEFLKNKEASEANNYTDEFYFRNHRVWNERISKAAFYASFESSSSSRQLIYDQATIRPDLFHAHAFPNLGLVHAWNFLSDEKDENVIPPIDSITFDPKRNQPGFIQPLSKFVSGTAIYNPSHYKYVIVPSGSGIKSTSGRLAQLLAHSGAVVLLQEAGFSYHFSARLQPWVHYVPLAYNMADATAKIEWLRANDDMAQQIAKNAINFGKSYLRLEDYYCYVANSLHILSEMQKEGGATEHSMKAVLLEKF